MNVEEMLGDIRSSGWTVPVHNDYHQDGEFFTFWLFTHPDGMWVKGEGRSDREALGRVRHKIATGKLKEPPLGITNP